MKFISFKHLIIGLCMFAAAGLAMALKPTTKIADSGPKVDLETLIPKAFGDWKIDTTIAPLIANPEQEALINKIYNQTLTRTYVNARNERVMLSIAYGGDQSDNMAVHKPEVCYPAQGFQIIKRPAISNFSTGAGDIEVKRLVAAQGARVEPITYWTTVGGQVAVDGLKWKLQQLKYGLTGKIPDGLLFRVSSIQADENRAYQIQNEFTREMLKAMSPEARNRIIGNPPGV
ncbi:MAG: EpsI family protein [Thiobacillus sp.]|nr:EpsI family protein [Thiobacillus sp.]